MDKKQKILLLIIGILVIMAIVIGVLAFKKEKNNPVHNKVNEFKEEYESLNGVIDDDGYTYQTVEIDIDAPVVYSKLKDVVELFDKEESSAVVFIGNAKDYTSRNAISPLLSAIDSLGIEKLYYVDSSNFDDNKTEEYQQIMKKIDSILDTEEIKDDEGNVVGTAEKKIYVPTVIVIKDKELVDYHIGTLEENMKKENITKELTKKEKEGLFDVYTSMLLKISDGSCNEETDC